MRGEQPLRPGQLATRNRAVIDQVMVGSSLVHDFGAARKRTGARAYHARGSQVHFGRAYHMLKVSGLAAPVVSGVCGLDVFIIRTAVEHHVSIGMSDTSIGVVCGLVTVQDVASVVNFGLAAQLEY